ncbi:ADP-ribosyltransferase [uncultured Corynebacterium sp.]|uniref:VG15 protein n=1 Tax=uncultured Corynebacterium sp. TaxID=159447 RepID=UPI00259AED6B|nr:ADP-ribosyltransferase [uncultured Corynebacterium sp.]
MSRRFLRHVEDAVNRQVAASVKKAVRAHGVPVTTEQARELVEELYPMVEKHRRAIWREHIAELGREAAEAGVELAPEPPQEYSPHALYEAVASVSRLSPGSQHIQVRVLDEDTQRLVSRPVMPDASNRRDQQIVNRIADELGRRVSRHVVSAGRQAVADATHNGSARFKDTGRPARVGYARVLSGRESCAFCAMLASRGPVYSDDTVVRRRDGRRYHDGCDCVPVLVVEGQPWEGQQQAEALYEQWAKHTTRNGHTVRDQFGQWSKAVASGEVDPAAYSPFRDLASQERAKRRAFGDLVSMLSMTRERACGYLYENFTPGKLEQFEADAVALYTDIGHRDINRHAREYKDGLLDAAKNGKRAERRKLNSTVEAMRGLDSLMDRSPRVKQPLKVVRRVRMQELEGCAIDGNFSAKDLDSWRGKEFKSWGYLSTSTHGQDAFGDIELRLTLPKGTKGVYLGWDENKDKSTALSKYPDEEELLLGRQTRYRINSVRTKNGRKIVEAEVIGQDV